MNNQAQEIVDKLRREYEYVRNTRLYILETARFNTEYYTYLLDLIPEIYSELIENGDKHPDYW